MGIFSTKSVGQLQAEAAQGDAEGQSLKRALTATNLMTLGIGAIIGAGIFVLTGTAAAQYAGPAIVWSFVLAGIGCLFAGLCYAEFASMIPIAGSAYTYGYATLGELVAWIIGWDLCLEYAFGAATVASGWSGYFLSLLAQLGFVPSPGLARFTTTWHNDIYLYHGSWMPAMSLPMNVTTAGLPHVVGICNLVAFFAIVAVTAVLVRGIKESANLNSAIVFVKLAVVGIFLYLGT